MLEETVMKIIKKNNLIIVNFLKSNTVKFYYQEVQNSSYSFK